MLCSTIFMAQFRLRKQKGNGILTDEGRDSQSLDNCLLDNLGLVGGLSTRPSVVKACPGCESPKFIPGLARGLEYAPGMGTASYVCSPGAAGTCSCTRGVDSKPSCDSAGVAE